MTEWLRRVLFLPPQASSVAPEIDALHFSVATLTTIAACAVFGTALVFVWRYHRSKRGAITEDIAASRSVESIAISSALAIFVLFWIIGYGQYAKLRVAPTDSIDVWVIARQWMWQFASSDGLHSEAVLVVPRDHDVRLHFTSRDVIHSFFVPAFRIKQDLVPGITTSAWFRAREEGNFPLFCAEYCGTDHSRMRASVIVLSPEDYALYRDAQLEIEQDGTARLDDVGERARRGERAAARYGCLACHTLDGQSHIAPSWAGLWNRERALTDGRTRVADAAYLTESMMRPDADVVIGFQPVMPSYRGVLEAADVAAIVELIHSLRDTPIEPAVRLPQVGGAR
jgi:cytochrome c oxidase subunit 2